MKKPTLSLFAVLLAAALFCAAPLAPAADTNHTYYSKADGHAVTARQVEFLPTAPGTIVVFGPVAVGSAGNGTEQFYYVELDTPLGPEFTTVPGYIVNDPLSAVGLGGLTPAAFAQSYSATP